MTKDELIRTLAQLVSGLQVPLSIGVPLGAANQPYRDILSGLKLGGWQDVDQFETALRSKLNE